MNAPDTSASANWRTRLHEVIFEADTPAGKAFDVALLVAILISVTAVVLDSVGPIGERYGRQLWLAEWLFTIYDLQNTQVPGQGGQQPGAQPGAGRPGGRQGGGRPGAGTGNRSTRGGFSSRGGNN